MEKAKNACLVFLWCLLAARVYSLISGSTFDKSDLVILALFAWLGGLVTGQLLERAYQLFLSWMRERHVSETRQGEYK